MPLKARKKTHHRFDTHDQPAGTADQSRYSVLAVRSPEFSAVLVKGRGNYISLRRLDKAVQRSSQKSMFEPEGQRRPGEFDSGLIRQKMAAGQISRFSHVPMSGMKCLSDHGDCLRKKCPNHADCFYYAWRRRVWNADLLIVNYFVLFFSDLSLRRDDASILPEYRDF